MAQERRKGLRGGNVSAVFARTKLSLSIILMTDCLRDSSMKEGKSYLDESPEIVPIIKEG
jgi:hypothetical protein